MRQPLFLELRFVPVAVRDQDLARLRGLGARLDRAQELVDGAHARERDPRAAARVMQVAIHQAWDYGAAGEIHLSGTGASKASDPRIVTDSDDAIAPNRHRLGDGEARIDGDDLPAIEDDVGSFASRARGAAGEQRKQEQGAHGQRSSSRSLLYASRAFGTVFASSSR